MKNYFKVTLHDGTPLYYKGSNVATVLYHLTTELYCPAIDINAIQLIKRLPRGIVDYMVGECD